MEIKDTLEEILENYHGRIWVIESGNTFGLQEEILQQYNVEIMEQKQFEQSYKDYSYTIQLLKKE